MMAVSEDNKRKCEYVVAEVAKSSMPSTLKDDVTDLVYRSVAATNGMTHEQKVDAIAQATFDMARLLCYVVTSTYEHKTTWKDVAVAFKWPLVILGLGALFLLALHPELADFFSSLAHVIRS